MYPSSSEEQLKYSVCRICLQTTKDSVNLFDSSPECKVILDKVYECFQVIICFENCFPHLICKTCIYELDVAHKFREKCISFEKRFAALNCHKNNGEEENFDIDSIFNNTGTQENSENVVDQDPSTETLKNAVCNICNKILKTKTSLVKHIHSMHQKRKYIGGVSGFGSTRRYNCTSCPYSTPHSQTLVNHMRRHDGTRPYICQCGKAFTQSSSLSAHQKTHSSTTYFTCTVCGKQFKHAYSLKKHLSVHESGTLCCNICNKILKSKQTLQDHMYRHFSIHNYNCEDCGDTFVTSSELTSHRKKHNQERKIECYFCGYKTHTKKSLILHLKRHTGDKQFKCELCNSIFYTQGDVKRHHRVHTHEKPYGCPTCSQWFTYSSSLNKHMLTVHGVNYKWGDIRHKEARKSKSIIKSEDK